MNNYLDKKDAQRLLNEVLYQEGRQPMNFPQMNWVFMKFDDGLGVIKRQDIVEFVD